MKDIEIIINFGNNKIYRATLLVSDELTKEEIDEFVNDTFQNSGVEYSWSEKT